MLAATRVAVVRYSPFVTHQRVAAARWAPVTLRLQPSRRRTMNAPPQLDHWYRTGALMARGFCGSEGIALMEITLAPDEPSKGWLCQKCGRSYSPQMTECGPCNAAIEAGRLSFSRRRVVQIARK